MKIIQEFREFIARGNVVDLAVGIIIGAAFGKIVNSLVNDVIMPPIGWLTKGINFNSLFVTLNGEHYETIADAKAAGAPIIAYGLFLNTLIEFFIIAACVFALVKGVNRLKRREEAKPALPPPPSRTDQLLGEIRDILKQQ